MRIIRLYMKNFIALSVAQNKREISIDFPEDKVINLLYGDMGSGKTFILGHCQPWHTFGTLDVRNGDPQIISGEDGRKIIVYKEGNDIWELRHDWIWSNATHSHTSKHYFKKNGVEMNTNGNLGTFNDLVKMDFGIDQDYLKMIRIGNNVSNIPDMKGTERKAFIASKLEESQFWIILCKKLSTELRNLNSQAKFILNNLGKKSFDDIEKMLKENEYMKNEVNDVMKDEQKYMRKINHNRGIMDTKLNGMRLNEYKSLMGEVDQRIDSLSSTLEDLKEKENNITNLSIEEVTKQIGSLDASQKYHEERLQTLTTRFEEIDSRIDVLRNRIILQGNDEQKNQLRMTYETLSANVIQLEKEVSQYPYEYSHHNLLDYINTMEIIDNDIETLQSYNYDAVLDVIAHGKNSINYANKQADILRYKATLIGSEMNNMQYAGTYKAPYKLFLPPFCPTKDCPYRTTHPVTIEKDTKKTEVEALVHRRQEELLSIQTEIAKFESYSYIYTIWNRLKSYWQTVVTPLSKMNLVKEPRLELVITKSHAHIDMDTLVRYVELAQKRGELFTLRERLLSAKDELNRLNLSDSDKLEEQIANLLREKDDIVKESTSISKELEEIKKEILIQNENYLLVSKKSLLMDEIRLKEEERNKAIEEYKVISANYTECNDLYSITQNLEGLHNELVEKIKYMNDKLVRSEVEIEQMKTAKIQYSDIMNKIHIYQLIVDSTSSKSGIPMEIVEMYMNECLDIINDLISGIFEDDLEIESFHPTEDNFLIPYNRSGHTIDDISKASQGEKSIIGISISFAMMENSMTRMAYNIPLLDEPDSALHAQDRNRFFLMLMKHMKKINSEQVIIISHNQTFEGYPMHIILTSDENYLTNDLQTVTRV